MKCFTIREAGNMAGINVESEPFPHVQVSKDSKVPLGKRDFTKECKFVVDVHPLRTLKGTLLLVKPNRPDDRALVLLDVSGARTRYPKSVSMIAAGMLKKGKTDHSRKLLVLPKGAVVRILQKRGEGSEFLWDGNELKTRSLSPWQSAK